MSIPSSGFSRDFFRPLGADTIASGCPFCMTMLTDGLKAQEKEEEIGQRDIAEILADAIELDEVEETPVAAE